MRESEASKYFELAAPKKDPNTPIEPDFLSHSTRYALVHTFRGTRKGISFYQLDIYPDKTTDATLEGEQRILKTSYSSFSQN